MANTLRSDPLRNFKFQVQISIPSVKNAQNSSVSMDMGRLGFMSCSGLSMTTEMIPYREGGMNTTTRKMPGQSDYPPVTLQRGLFIGQSNLFDWFKDIFFIDAVGNETQNQFRAEVTIRVLPHPATQYATDALVNTGGGIEKVNQKIGKGKQCFRLQKAWPTSMSWSDLDAGGNGIIMEQLTLVHEGLIPAYATSADGNAAWKGPSWDIK